jgi:putative addiction module component (TIGR02574 family)
MTATEEILTRALELPKADRALVAHQLLLSLEPDDFDSDSEAAWNAEIDRRLDHIESGSFAADSWQAAISRVRQSLSSRRSR